MDDDLTISILGPLSEQEKQMINKLKCESRCVFTREADCEDQDYFIPCEQEYILQIRGEYLLEIGPQSHKVIGGIKITFHFKFQIKRFFSSFASELAQPFAFVLEFPEQNQDQIVIKLGVDNQNGDQLENFAACLETKPIMQLDMHQNFKFNQRLSLTATACVYSATHFRTNKNIAIKCMKKDMFIETGRTLENVLKREYLIPYYLNHRNISKFIAIFDSDTTIYLIMELFQINFLDFVRKKGFRSAEDFRNIFKQICEAVCFLHEKGIMHRDIKLENIMMRRIQEQDRYQPVIIDFGLAEYEGKLPYIFTKCGTPGYTAPEIINCNKQKPQYTCKCDVFSLGSLFYCLLLRKPLFNGKNLQEVIEKNNKCQIDQQGGQFKIIHKNARQLLLGMLKKDPNERLSMKGVLDHPFFHQQIEIQKPAQNQEVRQYNLVRNEPKSDTE